MISDALFAQHAIRGFTRQDRDIAQLQENLSTGMRDPRVSADPARAMELSALRDLRADLDTQTAIGRLASDRLSLSDAALSEVSDGVRELYRITLQASNDTLTAEAHAALRVQAETLRATLLAAANTTDQQGRPLFSGTAPGPAFVSSGQAVTYQGNGAAPLVQMGPHARLDTGLTGARVFGEAATGVFALLDDIVTSLSEPMLSARDVVRANDTARLDLAQTPAGEITLAFDGPLGRAEIELPLGAGTTALQIDAINARTAETGIAAEDMGPGQGIRLVAAGPIALSDQRGPDGVKTSLPLVRLEPLDSADRPLRDAVALRPAGLERHSLVARSSAQVTHLAEMRAATGALGHAIDTRLERIAETRLTLDQAVSRLQDINVAEAITKLQGLLLNQQAAQQSFVKISGRSLFDYLG
ncbi:MAG: flagellin N-terminal helical domain-containing protein [Roseinatronobacter sp.]